MLAVFYIYSSYDQTLHHLGQNTECHLSIRNDTVNCFLNSCEFLLKILKFGYEL